MFVSCEPQKTHLIEIKTDLSLIGKILPSVLWMNVLANNNKSDLWISKLKCMPKKEANFNGAVKPFTISTSCRSEMTLDRVTIEVVSLKDDKILTLIN